MSERKVLNKYYPPDFDPAKIPRMKGTKNRQFTVRLMAPFNMRCATCGEYIYKGKKFNAKKEDVEGEDYLGIRIFRFYIKCTRCLQEISFKTDPKNTDYEIEAGATRNFMALKLAEEQAEREEEERKEEEASNPMKLLENRTKQSKHELDLLESLEELKDLNKRQQNVDFDLLLSQFNTKEAQEKIRKMQEEEDERYIKTVFGKKTVVKEEILEEDGQPVKKKKKVKKVEENKIENGDIPSTSAPIEEAKNEPLMVTKPEPLSVKPVDRLSAKSLGTIKRPLSNLVKLKPKDTANGKSVQNAIGASELEEKDEKPKEPERPKQSALSMLGSYSGSDSDST